jgi:hypothetical protein
MGRAGCAYVGENFSLERAGAALHGLLGKTVQKAGDQR